MKFRRARINQQKFHQRYEYLASPVIQRQHAEMKQLAETLSQRGNRQDAFSLNQIQELQLRHIGELVNIHINALFEAIEKHKYITPDLRAQMIRKTDEFLDGSVNLSQSIFGEGLSNNDIAHQAFKAGFYTRSLRIRQHLTNTIVVKSDEFNKEYKGYLELIMEHGFWKEVVKVLIQRVIPILGGLLLTYIAFKKCQGVDKEPGPNRSNPQLEVASS